MASSPGPHRSERDALGEIEVPADRLWGAGTERARRHFAIGDDRMPMEVVRALARVKKAAARENRGLGGLDAERAGWIEAAADEVIRGDLDDHFPLSVWQSGSGTQTNMNVNEVIANRASELGGGERGRKEPVHPNDHVNLSQSSNDAFSTAMHLAGAAALEERLLPAVEALRDTLARKQREFARVLKIGRTHLQDAVPLTLGQEIGGWRAQLDANLERLRAARDGLLPLAIGGTAVGTGLGAPAKFGERCAELLAEWTGLPFRSDPEKFAAIAAHDAVVAASGALRVLAASLIKIANDVRLAGSGPRAGLGELRLPENEPGSSIMPGKVNPTQCESLVMVATQVLGNDVAVGLAGAHGHFELNAMKPLLAHAFLHSARLLADGCASFREYCAEGIEPDRARLAEGVERSLMLVTALSPAVGYDRAAEIARKAHFEGTTLREACLSLGALSAEEFDALVRPERLTHPHDDD
jgi:fumarate hydratase class II